VPWSAHSAPGLSADELAAVARSVAAIRRARGEGLTRLGTGRLFG
jgi:hypothetical protein